MIEKLQREIATLLWIGIDCKLELWIGIECKLAVNFTPSSTLQRQLYFPVNFTRSTTLQKKQQDMIEKLQKEIATLLARPDPPPPKVLSLSLTVSHTLLPSLSPSLPLTFPRSVC